MKAYLLVVDDDGKQVLEHEFDPAHPAQIRFQGNETLKIENYEVFGYTIQPHLRVVYPKGFVAPPPTPWQGVPMARPLSGQVAPVTPSFQQGSGLASSAPQNKPKDF